MRIVKLTKVQASSLNEPNNESKMQHWPVSNRKPIVQYDKKFLRTKCDNYKKGKLSNKIKFFTQL